MFQDPNPWREITKHRGRKLLSYHSVHIGIAKWYHKKEAAVVNRVTCSAPVPDSTLYVHACHPCGALPAPGLAGCPVGRGD